MGAATAPAKPAGSTSASARLFNVMVMALLIPMLIVVLTPLGWMILTAFKAKGTAFRMEFLPKMDLVFPVLDEKPFPIASVDPAAPWLHVEYPDANATSAVVIPTVGGQEAAPVPMTRGLGGVWYATLTDVGSGPVAWKFLVNGNKTVEGGSVEKPSGPATPPVFLVVQQGGALVASVQAKQDLRYELDLGGERLPLTGKAGLFTGRFEGKKAESFRLVERRPFGVALAEKYTAANFTEILTSKEFNFSGYFLNSIIVATAAGLLTVLICTLGGYAFAVMQFHFRDQLFAALLASMLVPGMIFMVPQFSITLSLGMMDSYAGMVVPHLANVFGLFLLRQYIGQIPKDLFAAAEIDGARQHQIFQTIVIPVCLPIMVTLFLLTFVGQWSNFLWQLIINTGDSEVLTLPVGLQQFKGQNANEWEKIMAGACFSILPIAALFLTLQNYFMQGLTAGSVKE